MRHIGRWFRIGLLVALLPAAAPAQAPLGQIRRPPEEVDWAKLTLSIAAHGAASGLDAWTSWQRPERNRLLADGGRFTASSACRKAGLFAGVSILEVAVVKKWGKQRPWLARACRFANFAAAGMLTSGALHNLAGRGGPGAASSR